MNLTRNTLRNKSFYIITNTTTFAKNSENYKRCKNIIVSFCKGKFIENNQYNQADFIIRPASSPCCTEDFQEHYEIKNDHQINYISDVALIMLFGFWDKLSYNRQIDTLICYLRDKPEFLTTKKSLNKNLQLFARKSTNYLLHISKYTHKGNFLLEYALEHDDVKLFESMMIYFNLSIDNIDIAITRCNTAPKILNFLNTQKNFLYSEAKKIAITPADNITLDDWRKLFTLSIQNGKVILKAYQGNLSNIDIPDTIDGKKVVLSDSVFNTKNSKQLNSIYIGKNVEVSDKTFIRCKWLKDTNGFLIINDCLYGCWINKLTNSIIIPSGIKHIHSYVFSPIYFCGPVYNPAHKKRIYEIDRITLPEGVISIGKHAFFVGIDEIVIPKSVTTIHKEAFETDGIEKMHTTIISPKNSYAIQYAKSNGIKYKGI